MSSDSPNRVAARMVHELAFILMDAIDPDRLGEKHVTTMLNSVVEDSATLRDSLTTLVGWFRSIGIDGDLPPTKIDHLEEARFLREFRDWCEPNKSAIEGLTYMESVDAWMRSLGS
jgi:hypothetical protein